MHSAPQLARPESPPGRLVAMLQTPGRSDGWRIAAPPPARRRCHRRHRHTPPTPCGAVLCALDCRLRAHQPVCAQVGGQGVCVAGPALRQPALPGCCRRCPAAAPAAAGRSQHALPARRRWWTRLWSPLTWGASLRWLCAAAGAPRRSPTGEQRRAARPHAPPQPARVKPPTAPRPPALPRSDGSHVAHNKATGDNVGPLLVKAEK